MTHSTLTSTAIGTIAILLWSTLALFTAQSSETPPLFLLSLTFGVASIIFLVNYSIKKELLSSWKNTPKKIMLLGGAAFFFYHYLYFYAFQHAPAVDAGLIAYLWPVLIVIINGLALRTLKKSHLAGAFIALIGTGLIILNTHSSEDAIPTDKFKGYIAALGCAIIWSSYSVLNGRLKHIPSNAVVWYCIITAVLSGVAHALLEPNTDLAPLPWKAIIALGIGPVGIAFFCWDFGVKNGNISLLGVLSYMAPALSTIWLALALNNPLTIFQWVACGLITCGALIATTPALLLKKKATE
ncbi:aromatic amino acid exporter YddG [Marinomonas mediterranea]|uniref:EamA domain-containing protein n=1 Tax=Marinomonas mediterranea (strain ATCC 700492 / JCM 21426 / NBRC 103028 / MMB-1) TaxID=717774 RepID=F2JVS5_MARM1|nr:EamA family transporter [Marinomonas mediterranea]ADZ91711.1 protein of unknown function DUF6 transmembrane [Marinomonas mediterranea MMB-1]WCN17807.1 EamA family transporter [Marinomonas mediterranea MMB-1]